jgi:hypothetical protein
MQENFRIFPSLANFLKEGKKKNLSQRHGGTEGTKVAAYYENSPPPFYLYLDMKEREDRRGRRTIGMYAPSFVPFVPL